MTAMRFRGPVLPDGDVRDVYVVGDTITFEPQAGAETVAQGWIVPGLVDAHCHIGLDDDGAVSNEVAEQQAIENRDAGALLLRDCGAPIDTAWIHDRDDLPRLIRAGRHIARTKRYIRHYAVEVEPESLVDAVIVEAQRGDGWVKLVGDWLSREDGDLTPSFPADDLAAAIAAAHDHGAKVTAHCFGEAVLPILVEAGIDCIEHGTGLSTDVAEQMAERGVALVPTLMQIDKFPDFAEAGRAKFPRYSDHLTDMYARLRDTIMAAHELGVAIYAGTDGGGVARHGNLASEVIAMRELGMSADYALGAASWRGREWLGWNPTLDEGAPADFVVYPRDPLLDLTVLHEPSVVVLRGRVVA